MILEMPCDYTQKLQCFIYYQESNIHWILIKQDFPDAVVVSP